MKGYTYILRCSNGAYYTGSTNNLKKRLIEHQSGRGANFTHKNLPVELVYFEEFSRIDEAFYREKQIQGWSRLKKEALMEGNTNKLYELARCRNRTDYKNTIPKDVSIPPQSGASAPLSARQNEGDEC